MPEALIVTNVTAVKMVFTCSELNEYRLKHICTKIYYHILCIYAHI